MIFLCVDGLLGIVKHDAIPFEQSVADCTIPVTDLPQDCLINMMLRKKSIDIPEFPPYYFLLIKLQHTFQDRT
ncbi:hypothetical protein OKW21_000733 [Catalinimonas alkaloidigena]|nr:hypothetical protein [Catalinimonas alkaloidigena]